LQKYVSPDERPGPWSTDVSYDWKCSDQKVSTVDG